MKSELEKALWQLSYNDLSVVVTSYYQTMLDDSKQLCNSEASLRSAAPPEGHQARRGGYKSLIPL